MKQMRLLYLSLLLVVVLPVLPQAQGWPERSGCRGQNPYSPDWLNSPTDTYVYELGERSDVYVHMTGGMPVFGYREMGFTVRAILDGVTYDQRIICGTWADEYSVSYDWWVDPVGRIDLDFELLDIESRDPLQSDLVVNEGVTYGFNSETHRWEMVNYYRSMPARRDQEGMSACNCVLEMVDGEPLFQCLPTHCTPNPHLFPDEDVRVDGP